MEHFISPHLYQLVFHVSGSPSEDGGSKVLLVEDVNSGDPRVRRGDILQEHEQAVRRVAQRHRQILASRLPRLLRVLQPDVLDHLPAYQRRSRRGHRPTGTVTPFSHYQTTHNGTSAKLVF